MDLTPPRKILLRGLVVAAVAVVALLLGVSPRDSFQAVELASRHAWPVLALAVSLFCISFPPAVWGAFRRRPPRPIDWLLLSALLALTASLLLSIPPAYQVDVDESAYEGVALHFHQDRLASQPLRGYWIEDRFSIEESLLNKRSLLFPFLVSVLHDFLGWQPGHLFFLNTGLSLLLVPALYALFRQTFPPLASASAAGLLLTLPLFLFTGRAGGVEILNLLLLVVLWWLFRDLWVQPGRWSFFAAGCAAVLLAYCRNESGLFLLPTCLLLVLVALRHPTLVPLLPGYFLPLLLVPLLWQGHLFFLRPGVLETAQKAASHGPFNLLYLPGNFLRAWEFLFTPGFALANSLALSLAGILAAGLILLVLLRPSWRTRVLPGPLVPDAFLASTLVLTLLVAGCYFWSDWLDPITRRHALSAHFLLALLTAAGLHCLAALRPGWGAPLIGALLLALGLVQGAGVLAAGEARLPAVSARILNWKVRYLASRPSVNLLVIDRQFAWWLARRQSGLPPAIALQRARSIHFHLAAGSFDDILVFEWLEPGPEGALRPVDPAQALPARFVLRPVAALPLPSGQVARLSRLTQIRGRPPFPLAAPGTPLWRENLP